MTLYQDTILATSISSGATTPVQTLEDTIEDMIILSGALTDTQFLMETIEAAVVITSAIPHVYIFIDIDSFKVKNWTVTKNIQDTLWQFTADIDKHETPQYFRNMVVQMVGLDRDDEPNEKNYVIFLGFIPGANYVHKLANNKASISGYDNGWYLAAQSILSTQTVTGETVNPATTLKTMLGDNLSMEKTGVDLSLGNIIDIANWSNIQKSFMWKFNTPKRKAIDEMVEYTESIFAIKPESLSSGNHYPAVYFVADIDHATEGLNLPDIAVFTDPDPYLENITISINESSEVNRITIHGTNRESGLWATAIEETPEVTNLDVVPRELTIPAYVPEPPPADAAALQTAVDAKATEFYDLFYTKATTRIITAVMHRRADLQLWQKVGFVGYDGIPEYSAPDTNIMRIVGISYSKSNNENIVQISCIPTKDLSNEKARRMALGADEISGQQDIIEDIISDIGENEIGEVTAINGNVATVVLEKDSKVVEVRILNP